MTFGEHLEELRSRIIAGLLWLVVATVACFSFHQVLLELSMMPHRSAVKAAMKKRSLVDLERVVGELTDLQSTQANWGAVFSAEIRERYAQTHVGGVFDQAAANFSGFFPAAQRQAATQFWSQFGDELSQQIVLLVSPDLRPLEERNALDRFRQLRDRFGVEAKKVKPTKFQEWLGLGFDTEVISRPLDRFIEFLAERRRQILDSPPNPEQLRNDVQTSDTLEKLTRIRDDVARQVNELETDEAPELKLLKYTEGFMVSFKVALIFGILLALPLILWEAWKFVGAGLFESEQRYVLVFFPFSLGLFGSGAVFGYYWMVPFGLQFLAGWGAEFAELSFTLDSYINLFFTLTIILGLVFQTPLVMIFIHKLDIVTANGFAGARRYTLLGAVVFSTLVTPPDPLSWSLMAGPIMILYELGIQICRVLERTRAKAAEDDVGN